jgi:hypothetical protein
MSAAQVTRVEFPRHCPGPVVRRESGWRRVSSAPPLRLGCAGCAAANLVLGASSRSVARGSSRSAHLAHCSPIEPPTGSHLALHTREFAAREVGSVGY